MKVQAKVKVLNAAVQRTDKAGHDYMSQQMVMEATDGEGTARWIVSLNDEMQQRVREQAITVGCTIEVNILFDTFTSQNGYVGNKVSINAITLLARADEQQEAHSPPLDYRPPVATGESPVLSPVGKQVALVTDRHAPIRLDEEETVAEAAVLVKGYASGEGGVPLCSETAEEFERLRRSLLGYALGNRGEAGGKHLGDDIEVGVRSGCYSLGQLLPVGFG